MKIVGRRDGQHAAIIATHQLPFALVDHPVMAMAQKDHVVEIGRSAMDPVDEVMRRTPFRMSVATRPPAMAVAGVERPPRRT
jgi:hypothetical protein